MTRGYCEKDGVKRWDEGVDICRACGKAHATINLRHALSWTTTQTRAHARRPRS